MGRQINFFMMPEDVAELDKQAKKLGFVIIAEDMQTEQPYLIKSLEETTSQRTYLILPQHLNVLNTSFSEKRNLYFVNETFSPVIEFINTFTNHEKNILRPGRLYYNIDYFDITSGQKTPKPEDFLAKANQLFRWFRKHFVNKRPKNTLTTKNAFMWKEQFKGQLLEF